MKFSISNRWRIAAGVVVLILTLLASYGYASMHHLSKLLTIYNDFASFIMWGLALKLLGLDWFDFIPPYKKGE